METFVLWPTFPDQCLLLIQQRYAQIEKEALALTWACERFSDYLIGIKFHIERDYYRSTPIEIGYSPSELLVGWKLCRLPIAMS